MKSHPSVKLSIHDEPTRPRLAWLSVAENCGKVYVGVKRVCLQRLREI